MFLLVPFKVLLHRYSGERDINVGTPVANRPQKVLESLIGFFVNTVVIRSKMIAEQSFSDFLSQLKEVTLQAYAFQEVPFGKIVKAVQEHRDQSQTALFQTMFVFQKDEGPNE